MYKTKYKNHDSIEKQRCRNKIIEAVKSIKKDTIRVLTLPSTNFYLEEVLSNMEGVSVDCVERQKDIFEEQLKIIKDRKLNIQMYNNDIFDYLKNCKVKYDLVWLDLCGPVSPLIVSNFLSLVNSRENLSSESYIMLTILGAREHKGNRLLDFYGTESLDDFRQIKLPELAEELANQGGNTCKLMDVYNYPSGSKNAPMIMYSFHLKQKTKHEEKLKISSQEGNSKEGHDKESKRKEKCCRSKEVCCC